MKNEKHSNEEILEAYLTNELQQKAKKNKRFIKPPQNKRKKRSYTQDGEGNMVLLSSEELDIAPAADQLPHLSCHIR